MSNQENSLPEIIQQLKAGGQVPDELIEIFNEEAEEHLRLIYDGLARLDNDATDHDALSEVRRSAHTLKGAAGAIGLQAATRLSHRMEDLLDQLVESNAGPTEEQLTLFLTTTDVLQELTTGQFDLESTAKRITVLYSGFAGQLGSGEHSEQDPSATNDEERGKQLSSQTAGPNPGGQSLGKPPTSDRRSNDRASDEKNRFLRVPLQRLDELVGVVGEMIVNRSAMEQNLQSLEARVEEIFSIIQRTRSTSMNLQNSVNKDSAMAQSTEQTPQSSQHSTSPTTKKQSDSELDTLEFDRYTDFHLLAQVMGESASDIEIVAGELGSLRQNLDNLFRRQQRLNRDAQHSLMQVRMMPLSSIVNRLQRTVRTVAGKLEKPISLVVTGDHTELDKTVLDEIVDPLQHLMRNAMDHGVESPEQRIAVGKPEQSKIVLEAINQGTQVTLRISDDGRGIDAERVREKAIQNGLIRPNDELNPDELYRLIFLPGFSTATELTEVSGRGVGMDVVRDAIARLNGTIRVHSEPGQGTTFTIQLPTSVGVTQTLLLESGNRVFALPMQSVARIIRLDLATVEQIDGRMMLNVENDLIELRELASHLSLPLDSTKINPNTAPPVLVIQVGEDEVALLVESIIGGQEVVVKNFGNHLRKVPGLIGATVRGDGSIIPILDPVDLVGKGSTIAAESQDNSSTESTATIRVSTAMVIDDSISVRRVTSNLLQKAGWDVITACDGLDALTKLDEMETIPDVFLCDMEMPRMDGIELIKRLRKQSEFQHTPIVMVTSRGSEKHRCMGFEAGATEYVVKPFQEDQLLEMIDELVQTAWETVEA